MSDDESLTPTNGASQRVTPGQTAPTTPRITVDTEIKVDSKDAPGEPMVQDFADKYIPREFQPEHLQRSESPAPHVSSLQLSSDEESGAPAPPDLSRRGIHIPSRTSSSAMMPTSRRRKSGSSVPTTPDSRENRSYADSVTSYETSASSLHRDLPPLQSKPIDDIDRLSPLAEDDPRSFDLVVGSGQDDGKIYSLEKRSELMFSRQHLEEIFSEPALMLHFTTFLSKTRPQAIPLLIYYLDSLKALTAINYANAVAEALDPIDGHDFTEHPARPTVNSILEEKLKTAFDALVRDELPTYITHVFIQYVSVSIQRRITGTLPPHLRDASEGLAEVFCLTDPSRPDNPIVFASEEFHRTTQYGVSYAIGRNCRFLQGPRTNPFSSQRLRAAIHAEKEISEVFLNYRRDGSPFMNLLMIAPLFDSRGKLRYFIGAQVDVSGLVKECTGLDALQTLLARQEAIANGEEPEEKEKKDEFQELSEMLNTSELDTVRKFGGRMHKEQVEETDEGYGMHQRRLLLKEPSPDLGKSAGGFNLSRFNGKLEGIYQNYLLVRPYPSLRILFASASLRVPGMLQSPFLSRIGGSSRVRDELTSALAAGRGVTAKVRWIPSPLGPRYTENPNSAPNVDPDVGRARWIHCTPLLGHNGAVGVWMVVLVDEDGAEPRRKYRMAPPVSNEIRNGKGWEREQSGRKTVPPDFGDLDGSMDLPYERERIKASRRGSMGQRSLDGSRPGSGHTVRATNGVEGHRGAFNDWDRRREVGSNGDGGSMESFALM